MGIQDKTADVEEEEDPLESFMAEMQAEAKAAKPAEQRPKQGLELDEEDNVADYLEVRIQLGRL